LRGLVLVDAYSVQKISSIKKDYFSLVFLLLYAYNVIAGRGDKTNGGYMVQQTLTDLIDEYRVIEDLLIEASGEITEEVAAKLEAFGDARGQKLDGYAGVIGYMKGQIDYLKAEAEQYTSRAKALSNSIEAMRERMTFAMGEVGETKIKTEKHSYSVRTTQSWRLADDLPDSRLREIEGLGYGRFEFKPDIKAIKDGETDAPDFVTVTEKQSITIR